jgi:phenylalanyl-tRNA synthetase beta chain
LGIHVDRKEICRILDSLGNQQQRADDTVLEVTPPSWRRDLEREIDLIEEVARIYGYDQIPEDAEVPMSASSRGDEDRVIARIRHTLGAVGFDEAMTASVVSDNLSAAYSPWSTQEPLSCETPLLRGAMRLRRSLVPSLLAARRTNEKLANPEIELYEIANVYLANKSELPTEKKMIAVTSGGDFFHVKGALESVVAGLNRDLHLQVTELDDPLYEAGRCGALQLGGQLLGFLGEVGMAGRKRFELREGTTVAEIDLGVLGQHANLVPMHQPLSAYPTVERDLNFEVAESVRWSALADTVRHSAGPDLEEIRYLETYRDAKRLGPDRKSLVLRVVLRKADDTLTGEEADTIRDAIVAACQKAHGATLRA